MNALRLHVLSVFLLVLVTGVIGRGHLRWKKFHKSKHGLDFKRFHKPGGTGMENANTHHVIKKRDIRDEILKPYNPAVDYPGKLVKPKPKPPKTKPPKKSDKANAPPPTLISRPANIDTNLLANKEPEHDNEIELGNENLDLEERLEHPQSQLGANSSGVSTTAAPRFTDELQSADGPVIFTIANSNTKRKWAQLPYREKFQWSIPIAPCYEFDLVVPDEREDRGLITLCIYRQRLESEASGSGIISYEDDKHVDLFEQREIKVHGQVVGFPGSQVFGRIVQTYFYGEISLVDPTNDEYRVYVVEEVKLLSKLFHRSRKLFRNIVEVVSGGTTKEAAKTKSKYNAVVTRGASLLSFLIMNDVNRENLSPMPVVVLTTKHASYIMPGPPRVGLDENGQMNFASPGHTTVSLMVDGSVMLALGHKRTYTFRPNGTSMMKEGVRVTRLQKKEGSLAISAVSNTLTYGCVLPSHSFSHSRKGGYLCKVCLAADHLFQQKYLDLVGRQDTTPISFLSDVIDKVSWMYRSVDWNGDGKPDNIGLDYDLQFMQWRYEDDGSLLVSRETLDVLFESLSTLDFSDCCLGIAYTLKKFPHDIYAKSATSIPTEPGGICTLRKDGRSKNVILISAHSKFEESLSALTPAQLTYLTAHEIGKAFGARIDTSGQAGCDAFADERGSTARHYVLWPDVMRPNITLKEKSFSSCSKRAIVQTLDSCRASCFEVDLHPFCGNGVKEEGEECDCGSEFECSKQMCCFGRTGLYPCRKTGFACGPRLHSSANTITMKMKMQEQSLIMILLACITMYRFI